MWCSWKSPHIPFAVKSRLEFPLNQYLNFNPTSATASYCVSQDPVRVAAWPPLVFGHSAPWRGRRGWDRCGRCGDSCGAGDGGELGMGSAVSAKGHREGNEAMDVGDGPWCFFGFGEETAVGDFRVWTWLDGIGYIHPTKWQVSLGEHEVLDNVVFLLILELLWGWWSNFQLRDTWRHWVRVT